MTNRHFVKQIPARIWAIAAFLCTVLVWRSLPGDAQSRDHRNPGYPSSYSDFVDYQIDPNTILSSLQLGETNIFTPMAATPNPESPLLPSGSLPWTQSDFMRIANAISQLAWKEPLELEKWTIYYLAFGRECQNSPRGFNWMELTYYKTARENWKEIYPTRHIEIYPLYGSVSTGSSSNFDSKYFVGSNQTDFTEFNITADNALQLAEENGGKAARLEHNNDCLILIRTPIHTNDERWGVDYYPGVYFEMTIDPYLGKYELVGASQ